jgi:hypothetical protein
MRGGSNRKSVEQHIIDGTYRPGRHSQLLRDKKDFKNGNNKLNEILNKMEELCSDDANFIIEKFFYENKERCKKLGIPDFWIKSVEFTEKTKTAKNELEDEFIKVYEKLKIKYGNKIEISLVDINRLINTCDTNTFTDNRGNMYPKDLGLKNRKYNLMFSDLHWYFMFGEKIN